MDVATLPAYAICMKKPSSKKINSWRMVFPTVVPFKAVNGKKINLDETRLIHPFAKMFIKSERERSETVFAATGMGCVGCFLSHYMLWKKAADLPPHVPGLFVIEEDTVFNRFSQLKIHSVLGEFPQDADFVSLLYIKLTDSSEIKDTKEFVKLVGPRVDGMQCYFVTRRGGRILSEGALPMYTQADAFVGITLFLNNRFNGYALKTKLYSIYSVIKDNLNSTVQSNFKIKKYLPKGNRFYYSFMALTIIFGILSITLICVRKKLVFIVKKKNNKI